MAKSSRDDRKSYPFPEARSAVRDPLSKMAGGKAPADNERTHNGLRKWFPDLAYGQSGNGCGASLNLAERVEIQLAHGLLFFALLGVLFAPADDLAEHF